MKRPDLNSSLAAGLFGAFLLVAVVYLSDYVENRQPPLAAYESPTAWGIMGFVVGVGVQIIVRLTGVS